MKPTLFAMYTANNALFDGMKPVLPAAFPFDVVVDEIVSEYGESAPVMLDPRYLSMQITSWSARRAWAWNKYAALAAAQYDPLENYHRYESGESTRTPDLTHTTAYGKSVETEYGKSTETEYGKSTETDYGKSTETDYGKSTETDYGGTTESKVSAYNDSSYQPSGKSENGGKDTATDSGKDTVTDSGKDTVTDSGKDTVTDSGKDTIKASGTDTLTESGTDKEEHSSEMYGNIGTMTTQQMFVAEVELLQNIDFVKIIAQEFAEKFIIPVW